MNCPLAARCCGSGGADKRVYAQTPYGPAPYPRRKITGRTRGLKLALCIGGLALIFLPACKPLMVTADDVIARPGAPATLTAYTERDIFWGVRAHKRGYPVDFFVNAKNVGRSISNADACASVEAELPPELPEY